jgi:hypothetical protein
MGWVLMQHDLEEVELLEYLIKSAVAEGRVEKGEQLGRGAHGVVRTLGATVAEL